jgi:hypothetical protein
MPCNRTRWTRVVLVALTAAALARGQQSVIPPADEDRFVGHWRANAGKSRPPLDKKEASYERTIQRDGDELIFSSSGGASKAAIRQFRMLCDGRFHPLPTGPILSCRYVSATRVEGETQDPTRTRRFWAREVSSDGQQMMVLTYKDKARAKLREVLVLDRVK